MGIFYNNCKGYVENTGWEGARNRSQQNNNKRNEAEVLRELGSLIGASP